MTLLRDLVETSERVGNLSSRRSKVAEIAALLRAVQPDEIDWRRFSRGETTQRKTGIGYSLIDSARTAAASVPSLELRDVDRAIDQITRSTGRGSVAERTRRLSELFAAATEQEQSFLVRALIGELRQGALEGLMIEAVARAANLPVQRCSARRWSRVESVRLPPLP